MRRSRWPFVWAVLAVKRLLVRGSFLSRRYLRSESQHLFALTLLVGVVCGVVAVGFHLAIKLAERTFIDRAFSAQGNWWMLWTILTPTLGGLFAGVALEWVVPGARGSGIPQVKVAFATEGGRVRARDAIGKFFVATFQIGSGASLGREGPTVQICAGATSFLARATSLPPKNVRRLTPVGVAAGIAAAFNAPIAAVTFTIEEIVGTLDQAVLSGVVIAAAVAAVIERGILGTHPVMEVHQPYVLEHASSLVLYGLLGVAAAVISVFFTDSLLGLRSSFRRLKRFPRWAQPSLGGLVTGVAAVGVFEFLGTRGVTGGGYAELGEALGGGLGVRVLVVLCAVKILATVFSYSSGGAGGIFAPSLFIGAMLGGAIGHLDVSLFNHDLTSSGAFALVGMGAVFAGVIRAPITSVLIIFEMTGGYGLVLPLMVANMTSYVLARRLRPLAIYDALLEQDGVVLSKPEGFGGGVEALKVSDVLSAEVSLLNAEMTVSEGRSLLMGRAHKMYPVVDAEGLYVGTVSRRDLFESLPSTRVRDLTFSSSTIEKDADLTAAVRRMNELGVRRLVVLAPDGRRVAGVLSMGDVVRGRSRTLTMPETNEGQESPKLSELAEKLTMVSAGTRFDGCVAELRANRAIGLLARSGEYSVLLPQYLDAFEGEGELRQLLIARDMARPAPIISAERGLSDAMRLLLEHDADALVIVDAGEPLVLTRVRVAVAAFERGRLSA